MGGWGGRGAVPARLYSDGAPLPIRAAGDRGFLPRRVRAAAGKGEPNAAAGPSRRRSYVHVRSAPGGVPAMNAPVPLSRWTGEGSSRVPFWAYTDPQLYRAE